MVPIIEARFKWSAEEMLKAQDAHIKSSPTLRKMQRGALVWGVICVLLGIGSLILHRFVGLYFCVMGAALLSSRLWTRRFILKLYNQRHDRDSEVSWMISSDEITTKSEASDSRFEWRVISRVVECPQGFLLYLNNQLFHWLPGHAFKGEGGKEFAALAERHVKQYDRMS
jgi:hypothetical protein